MKVIRQKHTGRSWQPAALLFISLMVLGTSRGAAQSEPAAPDDQPDEGTERIDEIRVDEEITVIGQRPLRVLRLEVQIARERVYGLFNSLNSNDEFDIHCSNVPRTGTRIPQRVCRPQYADTATANAGEEFVRRLQFDCAGGTLSEGCLTSGFSRAQVELSEVGAKDQQLDAEVQRLARENAEFRRAIAAFQTADLRYDAARGVAASGVRVSASIIDSDGLAAIPSGLNLRRDDIETPAPIELTMPEAPWSETGRGALREGWVKLRYSVLTDGATADVHVVDTMPPGLDAAAPITAAQTWTFEPATAGGTPIDWHNNIAVITVSREQDVHEGWVDFAEAYEAVAALAADARYEEARSRNARMRAEIAATLEEMAFAEMQLAGIEHALGDRYAALDAIRRATEPAVDQLADEQLRPALEHRFTLEVELGHAADALATYERWAALGRPSPEEPMTRLGATLEQSLVAPETGLTSLRRIGASEHEEHALTWPTVAVGDVDGRIDDLELVCNRNKTALPFEPDVQMTIPAGWGRCVLLIAGQPDTTFIVYEFQAPVN